MNEVALSYNEKDLLVYFQQVRLQMAKAVSDENIDRTNTNKDEKTTLKETFNNLGKFFERGMRSYDKVSESANKSLEEFNKKHEKVMSKEEAEDLIDRLFEADKYGLAKLMFAASIISDNEYQYENIDDGLKAASQILYKDDVTLPEIRHQLEENFRTIASRSFLTPTSKDDKTTAGVAVALFALSLMLTPIVAVATVAVGAIVAQDFLKKNEDKIKEEFRKSSSEANAFYLALECTYIQRIKGKLSDDEFKEEFDSILKNVNGLKADLDYYLFVEKENIKENRAKSKSFHEFDNRLVKILELDQ